MNLPKRKRPGKAAGIVAALRGRIAAGAFRNGLPGIDRLAEEFGVNRKTVNRAIRELIEAGEVVRQPGRGTFVAGHEPAPPRRDRGNTLTRRYAFLMHAQENYGGYIHLLDGCDEVISEISGSLLYTRFGEEQRPELLLGRLRSLQVEGVLICSQISRKLLQSLCREFNCVLVDTTISHASVDSVVWDNFGLGHGLVTAMAAAGVTDCAAVIVHGTDVAGDIDAASNTRRRLGGMRQGAQDAGIRLTEIRAAWDLSGLPSRLPRHVLKSRKPGLICTDMAALPACALRLGCAPGSMLFGSFGDRRDQVLTPGRTIFGDLDMRLMGREAAALLADIVGRPSHKVRHEILTPQFIVLDSDC